jgi:hypothetical protein
MVLIPCLLLASFPPGNLFPQMAARMAAPRVKKEKKSDAEKQTTQTQSSGKDGQQQTTSGDESGPSEAQVLEKTP